MKIVGTAGDHGLEHQGLQNLRTIYWNSTLPFLLEQAIVRNEGFLTKDGALAVTTGKFTGRSPKDKFVVDFHRETSKDIWFGPVNQPIEPDRFQDLHRRLRDFMVDRDAFVQDLDAGAHPDHRIPIRVITENSWQSLFAQHLFRRLSPDQIKFHSPVYTVIAFPDFFADQMLDGTRSGTFIISDYQNHLILIGGTHYAGEIKKSVFTMMNYEMPHQGVLPMHCSANVGDKGDVSLFFGLSGTGKTTLSSDIDRNLIGDDEHGWADDGIFNIEGGCYAKTIHLDASLEPIIWSASHHFGTILENVVVDPVTREIDFNDDHITENTRSAYPIEFIPNYVPEGRAGHPSTIFFLSADAFGVLPPISRLTPEQAMYYFLSGYTAKLAGTESGLGKEPQATFSACFGAPFLALHPNVYAEMLGQKIKKHNVQVWLINTGWIGGPFGVGKRIPLEYTRAMVHAAMDHQLDNVPFERECCFNLMIPLHCPNVPDQILVPSGNWKDDQSYQEYAKPLIDRFENNFERFSRDVSAEVIKAGPHRIDE